ncbi:MAG TPA: hypothetical protein VNU71_12670, partial [Burkholderiaceae bacterium]|nr:hypothetical protein [Burkholderiaceae bacterium]
MPTPSAIATPAPPAPRAVPAEAIAWPALAASAIGVPMLLAFNVPPSSTFLNQAAALLGWGGWLIVLAVSINGAA